MSKHHIPLVSMLLMVAVTTAGCAGLYDSHHGSKVRANQLTQTVNPGAGEEKGAVAALEGQKAENLMNRYRKDTGDAPDEKLLKDLSSD